MSDYESEKIALCSQSPKDYPRVADKRSEDASSAAVTAQISLRSSP